MRRYTAQEMRKVAKSLSSSEVNLCFDKRDIAAMLRQAADDMEREKREKKYEYAVKESGSHILPVHSDYANPFDGLARGDDHCAIVRREVGEWEEVKDV